MTLGLVSIRAAVLATSHYGTTGPFDFAESIAKEDYAMRTKVLQPRPDDTMMSIQKEISKKYLEAGNKLNWVQRFWRERVMGHKMDFNFVFDEQINKFKVELKYRKNGGVISVLCNGRHEGREEKIAELMKIGLAKENIPYSLEIEDCML